MAASIRRARHTLHQLLPGVVEGETPVQPVEPRASQPAESVPRVTDWHRVLLIVAGIGLVIALVAIALSLHSNLDEANKANSPSAVQIVQVYTESLYQAVIAIGIAMGVYFIARALEE